jgi:hypothetical protein
MARSNLQQILFKRLVFTGSPLRARSADEKARVTGENDTGRIRRLSCWPVRHAASAD